MHATAILKILQSISLALSKVILLCAIVPMPTFATTHTLHPGPSIQDTLEIAADGDTLLLMPGVYDSVRFEYPIPNAVDPNLYGSISQSELTIMAEAPGTVVIGSDDPTPDVFQDGQLFGLIVQAAAGGQGITLKNLTFKHQYRAVWIRGGNVRIENCTFLGDPEDVQSTDAIIITSFMRVDVSGCTFQDFDASLDAYATGDSLLAGC